MKSLHLLLFAAGMPLLASAQPERAMPAAADANAPVTPLQYQSVFADYVTVTDAPQSPDKTWILANRSLLDEDAAGAAQAGQPVAGKSDEVVKPEPMHGKHQHEGAHQ